MAIGIVWTSTAVAPPLVLPPIDQAGTIVTSPLSLKLLRILDSASTAIGIQLLGDGGLRQLAEDVLAEPFLWLLETRQLEDAASLLRSWQGYLISNDDSSLIGEKNALRALEIASLGWPLDDPNFANRVSSNWDVAVLADIMEEALDDVLCCSCIKQRH